MTTRQIPVGKYQFLSKKEFAFLSCQKEFSIDKLAPFLNTAMTLIYHDPTKWDFFVVNSLNAMYDRSSFIGVDYKHNRMDVYLPPWNNGNQYPGGLQEFIEIEYIYSFFHMLSYWTGIDMESFIHSEEVVAGLRRNASAYYALLFQYGALYMEIDPLHDDSHSTFALGDKTTFVDLMKQSTDEILAWDFDDDTCAEFVKGIQSMDATVDLCCKISNKLKSGQDANHYPNCIKAMYNFVAGD